MSGTPNMIQTVKDSNAEAREMSCAYHCNTCSQALAGSRVSG